MPEDYRFELIDPSEANALRAGADLLRRVFPRARHLSERYLSWQYAGNPDGPAIIAGAFAGAEMVGHLAALPLRGRVEGEERRGLLLVNAAVDARHRGRGVVSRLFHEVFAEARRRGYSFCFSTGNRWSSGLLFTLLRGLRPLEARIGIGRLRRKPDPPRPSFERIWSRDSLAWRLADPERRYRTARDGDRTSVYAATGFPAIDALLLDTKEVLPATRSGSAPLHLWLGLDPAIDWRRSAYVPIPQWLRPSPLNLGFRDLSGGDFLPDPDRIVFRGLDFDAY